MFIIQTVSSWRDQAATKRLIEHTCSNMPLESLILQAH